MDEPSYLSRPEVRRAVIAGYKAVRSDPRRLRLTRGQRRYIMEGHMNPYIVSTHDERPHPGEWRPWRLWPYIRRLEHGLKVAHEKLEQR